MNRTENTSLSNFSSFSVGGPAEVLIEVDSTDKLEDLLRSESGKPFWFLGYGTNVLISDKGLPGTTFIVREGSVSLDGDSLIADAGVWWDDAVLNSIDSDLWGIELMSGIPGSVGAAVAGNIAAYGQAVADSLLWVEVIDTSEGVDLKKLNADELGLKYRSSKFQNELSSLYIVRAAFGLSKESTQELEYGSALKVANELDLDTNKLQNRREIILEARKRAGALYQGDKKDFNTAGSFFKNPTVTEEQVDEIIKHEENIENLPHVKKQNLLHGGKQNRVSAAHVLLAAGFKRGQSWGDVRLHPDHVLKIENTGNATAQDIYNVAQEIVDTVKSKLDIDIEPEVRFLGEFN